MHAVVAVTLYFKEL